MSIQLSNENGTITEFLTNAGYDDLCNWLEKYGMELSKEFAEEGYTEFPQQLIDEIEIAKGYSLEYYTDVDIKETIDMFVNFLKQCKDVAIVSDGTE